MLRKIEASPALMADLSEVTRSNTALAKYTGEDKGDLKLYKSSDGKDTYLRVTETLPRGEAERKGAAKYRHTLYQVLPPTGESDPAPTILDADRK